MCATSSNVLASWAQNFIHFFRLLLHLFILHTNCMYVRSATFCTIQVLPSLTTQTCMVSERTSARAHSKIHSFPLVVEKPLVKPSKFHSPTVCVYTTHQITRQTLHKYDESTKKAKRTEQSSNIITVCAAQCTSSKNKQQILYISERHRETIHEKHVIH